MRSTTTTPADAGGPLAIAARKARGALALARAWRERGRTAAGRRRLDAATAAVYAGVAPPRTPAGIAVFMHCGFDRERGVHGLVMRRLAARGWLSVELNGRPSPPSHPDPGLAALNGILERRSPLDYALRPGVEAPPAAWSVDLPAGVFRADGVDLYPVLQSKLGRIFRAYRLDWDDPEVGDAAARAVASARAAHGAAALAVRAGAGRGIPVRFVGTEHVYVPAGVPNLMCEASGPGGPAEFVDLGDAYAHYFTGGEYVDQSFMAVRNITRHGVVSRHIVLRDEFDRWADGVPVGRREALVAEARALVRQDWTGRAGRPPEADALLDRVRAHRAAGGRAACLFGHLAFDVGAPRDDGPAHRDMVDWLGDTLDAVRGTDVLLLVKPHTVEARHKPSRAPRQRLADLVPGPLPPNAVMLDPLWFNAFELFPEIDLGLVWRSSAAIELTLSGIPSVVCGSTAYYRLALDLPSPRDRADYRRLIGRGALPAVTPEEAERAALLLAFLPGERYMRMPYLAKPERRDPAGYRYRSGVMAWDPEALARFEREGDPAVERICEEIVG